MGVRAWGWRGRAHASHAGDTASAAVTACTRSIPVRPPSAVPAFADRSMGAAGAGPCARGQSATRSAPHFTLV